MPALDAMVPPDSTQTDLSPFSTASAAGSATLRPLRIVHVVDYVMESMGYQEYLLPKWNARHGHEVHVVTSDRYFPLPDYDDTFGPLLGPRRRRPGVTRSEGMTLHRLACSWEYSVWPWQKRLTEVVESLRPDVVFCHGTATPTAVRIARLARRKGIPLLMDNHMCFSAKRGGLAGLLFYLALARLGPWLLSSAAYRFLGVAQECCDFLRRAQRLPTEMIELLPLGLDTDIFFPDEAAGRRLRAENGIPADAMVVMQTGKLSPDKAPHLLSRALAPIMAADPKVWLVLIGSGPAQYIRQVRQPVEAVGAAERLIILPPLPVAEFAKTYNLADLCVYAGAASMSSIEAAACNKPVIMTDIPASRWRAEMGVGICYKTGDLADLEAKIRRMLTDRPYSLKLASEARQAVLHHFSYDAVARKSEELMYQAIEARHGQGGTGRPERPKPA